MRAWVCARTANESQNEWGAKVDAQLERLRRYARDHGWEIVGETREPATSGIAPNRPGLASLLKIADSHPKRFDILLVESLSRLSRDGAALESITRRLKLAGIEVCTTGAVSFPMATMADRMSLSIDEYICRIAEDVRASSLAAAPAGHCSFSAPFGYISTREANGRRTWAIHEAEAKVVRHAFHLALEYNEGPRGIARHLNDAGHTTRSGKAWSVSAIGRMLGNPIYSGVARIKAPLDIDNIAESITGIRISVPPIVSRQHFFSVQRICRDRTLRRGPAHSSKSRTWAGDEPCRPLTDNVFRRPHRGKKSK
ncbi:recombinase family protein [Mesorhizobium neociceri]|uniref:Recombinase family protein n=1 Tax=Mesorhizobium neociceri TaxID=1307853 RepID=A0A838B4C5_9HYPH|nr:recombinase family protein [Mesorhizobium neociceri]